jgi:asparagine synthase (glutamine-hydrolysing)
MKKWIRTLVYESRNFDFPLPDIILPMLSNKVAPMVLEKIINILKKYPLLYRFLKELRYQKNHSPENESWLRTDLSRKYKGQSSFIATQNSFMFHKQEYLNNYLSQITFGNNLQALLKYEDRNSMAFSVEGRVPFLDHRLVEYLFSLPSSFKMRNGFSKYIFRESMDGVLPEEIRLRKTKLGFATPEMLWQKTILSPLIEQALGDPKLGVYINPEQSKQYLKKLHQSPQKDFTPWRWLNLSLWMKTFNLDPAQP